MTSTWDCVNGNCIDPGTGNGTFASLAACQANCVTPTWDCDNGNCYDPGTGNGVYSSLSACQASCVSTSISSHDIDRLNIYPNPTNGILNISFSIISGKQIRLEIVNTIGEVLFIEDISDDSGEYRKEIDLGKYAKGIYFLEIYTDNGMVSKLSLIHI